MTSVLLSPSSGSRPSIFSPAPRAKFDAHLTQAQKYNSQSEGPAKARGRYISIAKQVGWNGEGLGEVEEDVDDIDFDSDIPENGKSKVKAGLGVGVSMMSEQDEEGYDGDPNG
jgi:hypothetical protein